MFVNTFLCLFLFSSHHIISLYLKLRFNCYFKIVLPPKENCIKLQYFSKFPGNSSTDEIQILWLWQKQRKITKAWNITHSINSFTLGTFIVPSQLLSWQQVNRKGLQKSYKREIIGMLFRDAELLRFWKPGLEKQVPGELQRTEKKKS